MKNLIIVLFVMLSIPSWSQDIHIYYNVHQDSIWYMKNGKSITNLEIKKDNMVYFHLVEFNNYLYKATFDVTQTASSYLSSATDSSGVHGVLPSFMSSLMGQGGGGLPFFNIPIFGNLLSTLSGVSSGQARGGLEEIDECKEKLNELESEKVQINQMIADINSRRKAMALLQGDFGFINNLCMSETIKPSTIKEMIMLYFKDVFMLNGTEKFDLSKINDLNSKLLECPQQEMALKSAMRNYTDNYKLLEKTVNRLKMSDHGIDNLYPLIKKFEQSSSTIMKSLQEFTVESQDSSMVAVAGGNIADYTPRIQTFYLKYEEITNNNFTYTHSVKCEEKYLFYTLNLFRKPGMNQPASREAEPDKSVDVKITSYGATRLFTSVGLSASKFSQSPQKYFVKDDILEGQDIDPYLAMISTMIHLGFDFRGSVMPAISLGLGIPVTTSETIDNFSFLFGPSLFVGKKRQFVLSGGVQYSKVERLAKGLQVGDNIQIGEGEIPTVKKYSLGYFVGISYNLGG